MSSHLSRILRFGVTIERCDLLNILLPVVLHSPLGYCDMPILCTLSYIHGLTLYLSDIFGIAEIKSVHNLEKENSFLTTDSFYTRF